MIRSSNDINPAPFRPRFHLDCASLMLAALAMMTGGCQSYERRPLDMTGHHTAFLARTPEGADVQKFAASLLAQSRSEAPRGREFDPTDGISCAEAELVALVFNADLRLARMRAGVTRASAENAGLWEDPTIGVDLVRVVESTPEPWKLFTSVGITVPISGRLEIEKQRAGVEYAAELARVARREWTVRMSVRRAWSEWSALDAQLAATREFLTRTDQILVVVDKMEQAGEMARTEARLFRIEKATKASELATLESRAREADLRLRQLMGLSPDAPLRFQTTGIGSTRSCAMDRADAAALLRRSPAMLVAMAEYEAAEKTLELEIRKQYPDLHIGPGYGREDGQDQVLLGLSMPIPVLNANRQRIAEASAQRELAHVGVETTLEQTVASFRTAELKLASAARRRQTLENEIVPLVDAQYTDIRQVARLGEVNTLVLLESLTRQQEVKVWLVEAVRDEALAAIDLDELIGPPASPPTSTPPSTPSTGPIDSGSGTPSARPPSTTTTSGDGR